MGKKCIMAELNGKTVSIVNNSERKEAGNFLISVKPVNTESLADKKLKNMNGKTAGKPKVVNINDLDLPPTTKSRLISVANNRYKKRANKNQNGCHKNVMAIR